MHIYRRITACRYILMSVLACIQLGGYCNANEKIVKTQQALNIIQDFAAKICKEIPLKGNRNKLELSGKSKAELKGIINKLVSIGIDGTGKYQNTKYQGLLQKDLLEGIKSSTNCRLQVWNDLRGHLLINQSIIKPRIEQNITGNGTIAIGQNTGSINIDNN